ncbi:hypothetical protein PHISCL_09047 [Aspergillus sclerotialis]|uniref:Uncharacterized protein n=1 Tax=Aspergillus sclerotialis TaxID=2070753 RepID=A0A3A2ZH17_9EURO|nr:hypothetical protein PHISCL_09047 [Aspergillus sclerotialis]
MPQQTSSLSISEVEEYNSSIQQNEQQNPTIDRIASSVIAGMKDEAIAAMKDAFTALRMEELNGPDPCSATEKLKGEIDALKRENEALKRGDQDTAEQKALPNVPNLDWLQGSRKRSWTDESPNGRTKPIIQCSQTDDDDMTDSRLVDKPPSEMMHLPFNDYNQQTSLRNDTTSKQTVPGSSNLRTEENQVPYERPDSVSISHGTHPEQRNAIVKRLRLSNEPPMEIVGKRKARAKKSNAAASNKPAPTLAPKDHSEQPVRRGRGRPRGSLLRRRVQVVSDDDGDDPPPQSSSRVADNAQRQPLNGGKKSPSVHDGSEKENPSRTTKNSRRNKDSNDSAEKHRQLVAMRDRMAEEAMRHEEEMAGEVGYYG